jgi:CRP/FNR family transcriptional regulator, cyclic AMP receptor protein
MASIASDILLRFEGTVGRQNLIEKMSAQYVLGANSELVEMLAERAKLKSFEIGEVIFKQEGTDTDIIFIVVGRVVLYKNGVEVERQGAGSVIGEIAVVDPGSYRSVTTQAVEPTVVASVSQQEFNTVADQFPFIWKRLAKEIADRLRRRGSFQARRTRARVFIASSKEALSRATALGELLKSDSLIIDLRPKVFQKSLTYIESLEAEVKNTDIAVLLLTPDDLSESRGITNAAPRDNLIFELGVFIGALSRKRTFFVLPQGADLKIPSDLLGVEPFEYSDTALPQIASDLRALFEEAGPR